MKKPLLLVIFLIITRLLSAQEGDTAWRMIDQRQIPEWFEDARFGIFIHWGVYSVPAYREVSDSKYASYAEWYYARVMYDTMSSGARFHADNFGKDFEYRDFAPEFKAELFNPDEWAEIFQNSGARYVVLTAKHHDGYCLWETTHPRKAQWNSADIGPHRDLVGELSEAVRKKGLRMGLYYSLIEWESSPTSRRPNGWWLPEEIHRKYRIPQDEYVSLVNQQLRELVLRYKPSVLFSDGGEWDENADYWGTIPFLEWLYTKSPVWDEIVVNDRWCVECPGRHGDYYSSEYQDTDVVGAGHPWEESRGMGGSYGYNRAENLEDYRSADELVHELVDIVSRGGNLLLNVGPTADGRIPVIMQERLSELGEWLKVNGEAIYGSKPFPGGKSGFPEIRFTKKDDAVYAICFRWPGRYLVLDGIDDPRERKIELLGLPGYLEHSDNDERMLVITPSLIPGILPERKAWVFKISFVE